MIDIQEIEVINPKNKEKLYTIQESSEDQIKQAFKQAAEAQKKIASLTVEQRVKEVDKLAAYILKNKESIMERLIQETGKTKFDALSTEIFEVLHGINYFRKAAPKMLKPQKKHTPLMLMGKKSWVEYQPLGTVFIIAPWNYPLVQCFTPSIMAFLAGNAVIFKPSELTPLKGLYEQIIKESGFMANAIQVLYGTKITGQKIIDQRPDKVHFTGSVRGGKEIMKQAAEQLIPVELELGGKDPALVFDDVNIDKTVHGVIWGAFTNTGQSCTSIERLYVQESIYTEFVKDLVDKTNKLTTIENSPNGHVEVGYMTSEAQIIKIEEQIKDAVSKGANILTGGKREAGSMFFPPTLIENVTHDMLLGNEETFGPVLAIMKFKNEQDAIEKANDSIYGLSASVWSKDLNRAKRVASQLITGNVSVNNHMLTEGNPALPFGGIKNSGIGRSKGVEGLHSFTNIKSLIASGQNKTIEPHWYRHTESKYNLMTSVIDAYFSNPKKWFAFLPKALKMDSFGNKNKID